MPEKRPRQQVISDTAANWAAYTGLVPEGIICIESDTGRVKLSAGATNYSSLTYLDEIVDGTTINLAGATEGQVLTIDSSGHIVPTTLASANNHHGALTGLDEDDHVQYVRHDIAGASNRFLVSSSACRFEEKTAEEVKSLLNIVIDHGALTGLADDDHPQYIRVDAANEENDMLVGYLHYIYGEYVPEFHRVSMSDFITILTPYLPEGGVTDHGGLTGLTDDDHSQYSLADGSRDFTGHVKGVATEPTHLQHLTNWSWVQRVGYNTPWRKPCRVATTSNIDVSSPPSTIDGVTLVNGDRVLVWKQTDATENGIYEVTIS